MSVIISEHEQLFSQKESLLESGIEFVGFINKRGRITDSIKNDIFAIPLDKQEMFFMKIALRNSMQKDFDEYLGPVNYCLTQRGDKKYISIPGYDEKIIFIVAKKEIDVEKAVTQIKKLLDYSKQILSEKNSGRTSKYE